MDLQFSYENSDILSKSRPTNTRIKGKPNWEESKIQREATERFVDETMTEETIESLQNQKFGEMDKGARIFLAINFI
jgi:hypothetical protein